MSPAELRRLLELAAKAMGYTTTHKWNAKRMLLNPPVIALLVHRDGELVTTGWNPADYDSDSRQLEVHLQMCVSVNDGYTSVDCSEGHIAISQDHEGEPCAATRLAVLRAAAAIGEAMP